MLYLCLTVYSLQDFIKKLNETKSNQDSNDPIVQISKILNSHMDVLQWVENQIKTVKINWWSKSTLKFHSVAKIIMINKFKKSFLINIKK